MKITLNLKILSIVLFSIITALIINSFIHYNNIKKDYLYDFYSSSEMDISVVKSNMNDYKKKVENLLDNLSTDEYIVATLNLISRYQDKDNYEPLIFDEEKKRLFDLLDPKINSIEKFSYGLFDKNGEPVLVNRVSNLESAKGIFTYRGNKLKLLDIESEELRDVPSLYSVDPMQLGKVLITVEKRSIGLRALKGLYDNNKELVGYIRIKKIFNNDNIVAFIKNTVNRFSFIVNKDVIGSARDINSEFIINNSDSFEKEKHQYDEIISGEKYLHHAHYLEAFDKKKIYFVVSIEKKFLDRKFKDLGIQLIFTAVIATIISFSIMIYFLRVNFLNRVDTLLSGIRKIKGKDYSVIIPTTKENDEIDEIALELNTLTHELKESTANIEKLNEFLQRIIDTVPVRIFWKDTDCKYLGANKLFLKDAGYENSNELIGKDDYDMPWGTKEAADFRNDDNIVMESKDPKLLIEETLTRADGVVITHLKSKVPMFDKENNVIGILGVYEDITEQKRLQKELKDKDLILYESSKMASMGEMLESIAHQWRQPLSVITTGATGIMINKEYGILTDDMLMETLDSIENSAMHLSQTIDDFRDFYKKDKTRYIFDIKDTIDKAMNLVKSKIKNRDIIVVQELDQIDYNGFENELIQVFMNMLNNAIDELEEMERDKRLILISAKVVKKKILISFKDNAGGIGDDVLPYIFDHKFTTKGEKDGTGIGLYMSKLIIEKSGGKIEAGNIKFEYEQNSYFGAEFIIELPFDTDFS